MKKFTKILALLLVFVMAAMMFSACTPKTPATSSGDNQQGSDGPELSGEEAVYAALDKSDWPKSVTLIAGPQGGPWYPIMVLLCEICNEYLPEVSWNVIDGGSLGNIRVVNEGEDAQIGFTYYALLSKALEGSLSSTAGETFPNISFGNACNSSTVQVTYPAGTKYSNWGEVVTHNFAPGQLTAGHVYMLEDLLGLYGYDGYDAFAKNGGSVQFKSYTEMATLMKDKHIDVASWCGNVPHSSAMDVDSSLSLDLYSFTDEEMAYLKKIYPAMEIITAPAGSYSGQKEDAQVFTLPTCFMYNKNKLPGSLIYAFTYCTLMHSQIVRDAYAGDSYTRYFNLERSFEFVDANTCDPNAWKAYQDLKAAN